MKLVSWLKNICIAGLLLTTGRIAPFIETIDVFELNGKHVYILGDHHQESPLSKMHKKLFLEFLHRMDKNNTHVIIEDTLELYRNDPTTYRKIISQPEFDALFLLGLTEKARILGYSVENIECRELPLQFIDKYRKGFEEHTIPLISKHMSLSTNDSHLHKHYTAKMDIVARRIAITRKWIAIADEQKLLDQVLFEKLAFIPYVQLLDAILFKQVCAALEKYTNTIVCVGGAHAYELRLFLEDRGFKRINMPQLDIVESALKELKSSLTRLSFMNNIQEYAEKYGTKKPINEASQLPQVQGRISAQLSMLPLPAFFLPGSFIENFIATMRPEKKAQKAAAQ